MADFPVLDCMHVVPEYQHEPSYQQVYPTCIEPAGPGMAGSCLPSAANAHATCLMFPTPCEPSDWPVFGHAI